MSRTVAERKALGTTRYSYRDGAAHLPRACVTGTRASGTRGDETPSKRRKARTTTLLPFRGGAPQNGNGV